MTQSTPGFITAQVPTATQWNGYFAVKQDAVSPLNAVGNGSTDDLAQFQGLSGGSRIISSPASNYHLSANYVPAAADVTIIAAGDVTFSGAHPDYNNLIPYEAVPGPMWAQILSSKTYGTGWAGTGNVFQIASYAKANVTTVPIVAVYGQGEAAVSGSRAWGSNFAGVGSAAGATAITCEMDPVNLNAGATVYGIVIASSGTSPIQNAEQIGANDATAQYNDGWLASFVPTRGCVTGSVWRASGDGSTNTCTDFLKVSGVKATTAEIDIPSLLVDPSPAYTNNRLRVKAGSTGNDVLVTVDAVDTNAGINIAGHGTSGGGLLDGSLNFKMKWSSTGIGFYGTNPVSKQTVTGAKGSNAALASLLTALVALGIITDSTSA